MTTELLILIAAHFACTDIAVERPMNLDEARHCASVYDEVKLSFVPGVSASDYRRLDPGERSAVSKAGFLAFYQWRAENPEMVRHLVAVARGEEALKAAG